MKDVLLKIMDSCYDEETTIDSEGNIIGGKITLNKEKLATEIADMAKAFDEWKDKNINYKEHENRQYELVKRDSMKISIRKFTYNDLFNYWYNEIYMKK